LLGADIRADDPAAEDHLVLLVLMVGDYSGLCHAVQRRAAN
jgi:hypothetical protein